MKLRVSRHCYTIQSSFSPAARAANGYSIRHFRVLPLKCSTPLGVDKMHLEMNIACMAQRLLALLVIIFWLGLSGIDVLEDLDFPDQVALSSSSATPLLDHGRTARLTNNIVETAGHSKARYFSFTPHPAARLPICSSTRFHKTYKLHKLHHTLLI